MVRNPPPHIRLRPITDAHREPLYGLHRRAMHDYVAATWGWDEGVQREFWRRTAHDGVQVIEVDGNLAGFLDVAHRPDHVDVVNIELDPAYQGRGIGGAILGQIVDDAAREGLAVRLQVLKANPRAQALYERLGFMATGETPTHVLMERHAHPLSISDQPLGAVLTRISLHPLVDGIMLVGSTGTDAFSPTSDYDILLVLEELPAPLRIVNTWVGNRLTEVYVTTTAAIQRAVSASSLEDTSEAGLMLHWLREGRIAWDRSGLLRDAQERALVAPDPTMPGNDVRHEAWRKIGYNLAQMKRYLAAGEDLVVDMRLLYSVSEVTVAYFTVRQLPWRGEKAAVRYWMEHDPAFLALLQTFLGETDRATKVECYESLANAVLALIGPPWRFGETIVSVGPGWGTGQDEKPGSTDDALALWSDIVGRQLRM